MKINSSRKTPILIQSFVNIHSRQLLSLIQSFCWSANYGCSPFQTLNQPDLASTSFDRSSHCCQTRKSVPFCRALGACFSLSVATLLYYRQLQSISSLSSSSAHPASCPTSVQTCVAWGFPTLGLTTSLTIVSQLGLVLLPGIFTFFMCLMFSRLVKNKTKQTPIT